METPLSPSGDTTPSLQARRTYDLQTLQAQRPKDEKPWSIPERTNTSLIRSFHACLSGSSDSSDEEKLRALENWAASQKKG